MTVRRRREPVLPPRFVDGDRGGVRQVQRPPPASIGMRTCAVMCGSASVARPGRWVRVRTSTRRPARSRLGERRRGMCGERVHPLRCQGVPRCGQVGVNGDRRQVVVVQAGTPQLGFGQVESERLDQMQFAAGRRRPSGSHCRCWARCAARRTARGTFIDHCLGEADSPKRVCSVTTMRLEAGVMNSVCSVRIVESARHDWHTRPIARRRTPARRCGRISRKLMNHSPILKCRHAADSADSRR